MITDNLFEKILLEPSAKCNQLKIVSGYASPAMANKHLMALPVDVSVSLVVGMVPMDGMGRGSHIGFQMLDSDRPLFCCNYVIATPPVHIKTYIWLKDGIPKYAFTGSGNYSQNAFFGGSIESFAIDDPIECHNIFSDIQSKSLNCLDSEIETKVKFYEEIVKRNYQLKEFEETQATPSENSIIKNNCVNLSLLDSRTGETHRQSGLNWGQRLGREPNQAYIPIPSVIAQSKFFPPRANHFTLITDDGMSFDCAVAQAGDKAIHTTKSNSILGGYFRKRLGVGLGEFVFKSHLDNYGRTDVKVCKIDNETYFLDFSA